MALTAHDLTQIKIGLADVIDPRFADTNHRIDRTNSQLDATNHKLDVKFGELRTDLDNLSASTNRKFHAIFTDVAMNREDLHVVKQMVTEHGFRIARLENKPPMS